MDDKETKKRLIPSLVNQLTTYFDKLFHRKKRLIRRCFSWEDVPLDVSKEVGWYLEMRHVLEDEVKQVIFYAETTSEKLYQPDGNRYLGKLRIGKATFYTDYSYGEDKFIVRMGYAHRSEIVG
jgi:hypothetical protein